MDRFDYLIVGAGFAGSVCAERLASAGKTVLLIDQRNHVGGNAYDYYDDAGILVHKYGAHIFHTNSKPVVDYLSQFTEWRPYEHRVLSSTSRGLVPVPINRTTLAAFGGDEAAARAENIEPYTRKQWGPHADALAPTVLARIKTRDTDDDRYFTDRFQAMPRHGYTRLFEKMLAHPNIKILLKASWREIADMLPLDPITELFDGRIIFTGPIDEFFDYRFGRLPYRSARFEFHTVPLHDGLPEGQKAAVVNYPGAFHPMTRSIEFTKLTGQEHPLTTLCFEYPSAEGEPYWPVPTATSAALYKQYADLAAKTPDVHFLGRLGSYQYFDMHQVIAQALVLSERLLHQEAPCPVPL